MIEARPVKCENTRTHTHTVGSSWAALAVEEDPQGRGIGTLMVEAGAERGGGWEGEGRGGEGGRGGGGVGQREQREDPLATQPDREIEPSQTKRGVGGVCVGVVSRVQSKLWRALHAHRGKKLLQDLQTQESTTMKESYGKVQGSAGEGHHGICGMPGGSARRHDGGPPVEGSLRQEPGVAWRGGTCWWGVSWQWLPARNHPPPRHILHKDGMELSHSQSGASPGTDSIPSRE